MRTCAPEDLPAPEEVRAAVLDFVQRLRARALEAETVVVFGSAARGQFGEGSDVDVLVRWRGDELAASRLLAEVTVDILLERGVDIAAFAVNDAHHAAWQQMGSAFFRTVEAEGLVVA